MKKSILTIAFALLSIFCFGKSQGVLTFMGIPIDGTEPQFIPKLQDKGFEYNQLLDCFTGQFNGYNVQVKIHTNHRLIDRIYVSFPLTTEADIKNEFNHLRKQFIGSKKYLDLRHCDPIPDDEDISYEMSVHNKSYQVSFSYFDPDMDKEKFFENVIEELHISESQLEQLGAIFEQALEEFGEFEEFGESELSKLFEQIISQGKLAEIFAIFGYDAKTMSEDELVEVTDMAVSNIVNTVESLADGSVWFTIFESGGSYNIGLYYDNLHNRPHGEDL